jgi:predicted nuclease of predicted toxin-antitoxin system
MKLLIDMNLSPLRVEHFDGRPSVLQLRAKDVLPAVCGPAVVRNAREHAAGLEAGAIVTIDTLGARVRTLPIGSRE